MASQSLYRKWRSQTFDEMVGQESIILTLRNALKENKLRHAYLFTGPRGTGKTTTARLLAKIVNCTNPQNGEPCNECQQCREITAGTSLNVIEIDAASNRGIDSIRGLRDEIMAHPAKGKYKVYILDEAHMLTTEAFNALLKTLEEPPDYAILVLATTDVYKMLPTVISRCQRFDFKRFSTRQIVHHLLFVAKEEGVEVERSAAELIARAAAGGMRDALSLLDQAIAYSGNVISLAQVQSMLGVADPRAISKLVTHIARLDSPSLLYLIHELSEAGADLRQLNAQVIEYWRALLLAKAGADVATIMDLTEDEVNEIQQLVPNFTLEELTECARIFAQNDLMQKNQGTPQLGLELASLECIESHRRVQEGQPPLRTSNPTPVQVSIQPPAASGGQRLVRDAPQEPVQQSEPARAPRPAREEPPARIIESAPPEERTSTSPAASTRHHPTLTLQQVEAAWTNVIKRTHQRSGLLAAFLKHWQIVGVEGTPEGTVILIQAANQRHFDNVRSNDRPKDIEWAFSTEFSQPCKVRLVPPGKQPPQLSDSNIASYSFGAVASQTSAYRERTRPAEPLSSDTPPAREPPLPSAHHRSTVSDASSSGEASDLARLQGVRENKRIVLSKEELGQKVQKDPVVQEVVRMFGAKIADIQPK